MCLLWIFFRFFLQGKPMLLYQYISTLQRNWKKNVSGECKQGRKARGIISPGFLLSGIWSIVLDFSKHIIPIIILRMIIVRSNATQASRLRAGRSRDLPIHNHLMVTNWYYNFAIPAFTGMKAVFQVRHFYLNCHTTASGFLSAAIRTS